jgi:universal stress protein A
MNSNTTAEQPPKTSQQADLDESQVIEMVPAVLKLKTILVPLDFSEASNKALGYAVPFARQFDSKIILLHVIEPLPYPVDLTYVPLGETLPVEPLKERLENLARERVPPELLGQCRVEMGIAFEVITDVARELSVDLIIVTTHGYTGLKRVFLGSTAERIVRHAPCPVLTVRECEHEFV